MAAWCSVAAGVAIAPGRTLPAHPALWKWLSFGSVVVFTLAWAADVLGAPRPTADGGLGDRPRPRRWWPWLAAVPFAIGPALFSSDVFAYVAQGRMVAEGIDPYRNGPAALADQRWLHGMDALWLNAPVPYGPVWLRLSQGIVAAGGSPGIALWGFRCLAILTMGIALAGAVQLLKRFRPDRAHRNIEVALLLSPMWCLHALSGAHNDAVLAALVVWAAVGFCDERLAAQLAGCVLLAAALLVKAPAAVVLAPLAWWATHRMPWPRRAGRLAVLGATTLAATTLLSWACGLGWGWIEVLRAAPRTSGMLAPIRGVIHGANRLVGSPLDAGVRNTLGSLLGAVFLGTVVVLVLRGLDRRTQPLTAAALVLGAALLIGPSFYAWYLLAPLTLLVVVDGAPRTRRLIVGATIAAALLSLPQGGSTPYLFGGWVGPWITAALVVTVGWYVWRPVDPPDGIEMQSSRPDPPGNPW